MWPDRARIDYRFATGDIKRSLFLIRRPSVWVYVEKDSQLQEFSPPSAKEKEENVAVAITGQYWLPMLLPLVDPKTIVFGAAQEMLEDQRADVVKASIPGCPVFTLWFNEKTSLLGLVTCTHQEGGATIQKRFTLTGYKPIGGVQLPTRIELARNTQTVEQWEVTSWDFVDKIDDAVFDLPAK